MAITLTTLRVLFTSDTRDLDRGFRHATNEAQRFARAAVQSAISLQQYLTYPLKSLLDTQVAYRDLNERSLITFKQLLGNERQAVSLIETLKEFAVKTPFEFEDLLRNTRMLNAFGVEGKQLIPVMRSISDAVSGLGGNAETIDRVTLAFGKLKTEGKLNAGIMRQFTTAGIRAWQILADKIGVSIPVLRRMTRDGIIPAEFAFNTLISSMEDRFPNFSEKFGNTFSAALSNIKDATVQLLDEVLLPTLNRLKEVVLSVSTSLLAFKDAIRKLSDEDKKLLGIIPVVIATMGAFALALVVIPVLISAIASPIGLVTIALGVYAYNILVSKEKTEEFSNSVKHNLLPILEVAKVAITGLILFNVFATLGTGITTLAAGFATLVGAGRGAASVLTIAFGGLRRVVLFLVSGFGGLRALVVTLYAAFAKFGGLQVISGLLSGIVTNIGTALSAAISTTTLAISGFLAAVLALVLGAFEDYTGLGQALLDNSNTRSQQIAVAMGKAFEVLKEVAVGALTFIIWSVVSLGKIMQVVTGVILVGSKLIYIAFQSLVHLFGITIGKLIEATGVFGGSFESFADSFGKAFQNMIGWTEASEQARKASRELENGVKSLSGAFGKLGGSLGFSEKNRTSNDAQVAYNQKLSNARLKYGLAIREYENFKKIAVDRSERHLIPISQRSVQVIAALGLEVERKKRAYLFLLAGQKKANAEVKKAENSLFDDFKKASEEQSKKLRDSTGKYKDPNFKEKDTALRKQQREAEQLQKQRQNYIQGLDKKIHGLRHGGKQSNTEYEIQQGLLRGASEATKDIARRKQHTIQQLELQKKAAEQRVQETKRANDFIGGLNKKVADLRTGEKGLNIEWEITNGILKNMGAHYHNVARQRAKQIKDMEAENKAAQIYLDIKKQLADFDTGSDSRSDRQKFAESFSFGDRAKLSLPKKNELIAEHNEKTLEKDRSNAISQYYDLIEKLNVRLEDEDTLQGRVNKKLREELDARKELKELITPDQYIRARNLIEQNILQDDANKKRKQQLADYDTEKTRLRDLIDKKEYLTQVEQVQADIKRGAYDANTFFQREELVNIARQIDAANKAKEASEKLAEQKKIIADIERQTAEDVELAKAKRDLAKDPSLEENQIRVRLLKEHGEELSKLTKEQRAQAEATLSKGVGDTLFFEKEAKAQDFYRKALKETENGIKSSQLLGTVQRLRLEIKKELENAGIDAETFGEEWIDDILQQQLTQKKLDEQKKLFTDFLTGVQSTFESAFKELFNKGFKGFFNNILKGFEDLIEQMVAKWLGSQLFKLILGAFGADTSIADNFRAVGGSVSQNEPYVVGERGAELFVPQQSGTIVPNSKLGSTGNTTINITVHSKDAEGFRRSQSQILAEAHKIMSEQNRRNG